MKVKDVLELIVNITQNGTKCEEYKEQVNDHPKFEPYAIFTRIDREDKGYLTKEDFINFLTDNKISIPLNRNTVDLFIEYYDRDFDAHLSFSEFLNFILNKDHNLIRSIATQRETYKLCNDEYLEDDLEQALSQLIMSEFFLFEYANVKKLQMLAQFNSLKAYEGLFQLFLQIDSNEDGYLSLDDWNAFLSEKRVKICPDELMSFLSLYDEDLDGQLNWNEFLFMILPSPTCFKYNQNELKKLEQQYDDYYFSSSKKNDNYNMQYDNKSNQRKQFNCNNDSIRFNEKYNEPYYNNHYDSNITNNNTSIYKGRNKDNENEEEDNTEEIEPTHDKDNNHYSNNYNNHSKGQDISFEKSSSSYQKSNDYIGKQQLQQQQQLPNMNESFSRLSDLLFEIIDFEKKLLKIRHKLSKDPNFNINNIFALFDKYNNQYISLIDFQEALEMFDIVNKNAILVFGKYDQANTGRLTINDFYDMLCCESDKRPPVSNLRKHHHHHQHQQQKSPFNGDKDIDILTKTHLSQFFNTMIDYVTFLNTLPKWYAKKKSEVFYCFDQLDLNQKGYINEEEFNSLFLGKIEEEDLLFLMEKIDSNKDGNITLEDFICIFK